jgi:hypothetical protein
MTLTASIPAVALTAAVLALAAAQPSMGRDAAPAPLKICIERNMATSWRPDGDHAVLVDSGRHTFRLTTNSCPRLNDPLPTISTVVRGGDSICSAHDVQLYVNRSPCFVQSIEMLPARRDR